MRKMNVLITLVLLFLMANSASAVAMTPFDDGCYCVKLVGDYGIPISPASISVQQTSMQIPIPTTYHIETDARVCKSGDDITVTVLGSNPGVSINELVVSSLYKEQIILTANGTCEMGHSFEGTMILTGDGTNYISTSATGLVDGQIPVVGSFSATIGVCQEQIPEFPTIALPMIAIIGLALIIQRRKE